MAEKCFICRMDAKMRCEKCAEKPWFCGTRHAALHSSPSSDKDSCFPVAVRNDPDVGRFMVTTRAVKAGEVLFEERPLAVGPCPVTAPQCLQCGRKVDGSHLCPECGMPMCDEECSESSGHRRRECGLLRELRQVTGLTQDEIYLLILPMRLLLLRDGGERGDYDLALTFMDHESDRKNDSSYWDHSERKFFGPLREAMAVAGHFQPEFTSEDVQRAFGIAEVNNYELANKSGNCGVRGLLPLTSLLSHSCVPNARLAISSSTRRRYEVRNRVIAAVDLEAGSSVTINYVHLHLPNSVRRPKISENWYFECACARCSDVAELGTMADAVACKECPSEEGGGGGGGFMLPQRALDEDCDWSCGACGATRASAEIRAVVERLTEEKESLDRGDLPAYVEFSRRCSEELGPRHGLVHACRKWIIPLYCRITRADHPEFREVSEEMLADKRSMCEEYLKLLDTVEPGMTLMRGRVLFELADCSLTLEYRRYQRGVTSEDDMASMLSSSRRMCEECMKCLKYDMECEGSFERHVFLSAKDLVLSISAFEEQLSGR